MMGKVCRSVGHGLKNGGRPCPWKWPCRGLYGRLGGHGLLQKNRLCPKPAQTLPAIRATMPPGTIPALGERSGYPMEYDGMIRKSLVHRTFLEYCKQLLNFDS